MKRKNITNIYVAILALLMFAPMAVAQGSDNPIRIVKESAEKKSNKLTTSFDVVLGKSLKVGRNDMIIMTPVLKSKTSDDVLMLDPVVVMGGTRDKVVRRNLKYKNETALPDNTLSKLKRKNGSEQVINYSSTIDYKPWMRDAELVMHNVVSGCANCDDEAGQIVVANRLVPEAYKPSYKLTYIVPEVEPVKERSDRHTATFNFVVDRYELLRDYKGNRAKFEEVDKIISDIQADKDLKITEFNIEGYASPEASVPHNKMLAENRAKAFADYLVTKLNVSRDMFTVSSHGEDWVGLRKAVEASNINDKSDILRIIDTVENPDARDTPLKELSNGDTYRTLLNTYYPPLRRTDYTVAYVVRAFNVEEAKEIIKKNPKLLSLNEMYLVAETYPAGSDQFKEVFDIALRLFPDSEIAIANAAAVEIEGGHNEFAIRTIEKSGHQDKMLNNLGIAYARAGKYDEALKILTKAANSGDADAKHNLEELKKVMEMVD